jgi:hypothetical protein
VVGVEVESYEIQQLKKTIKDGTVQQLLRCHLTLKKPMVYKNYPNESETVWSFAPDKGTNFSHLLHEGQFLFPGSNTKLRSLRDTLNILAPNEPA